MEPQPLLRVSNLTKHFPVERAVLFDRRKRFVKALNGISFEVQAGQTLALVGESGCGKTTAAKVILRLEDPTEGHVFLGGEDIHTLRDDAYRAYRTRVQAVFQDPWSSLNPRMIVRETISEPLVVNRRLPRDEVREKVEMALLDVGLDPSHSRRFPHEFSGGQRQRIAIASALISEPDLIVLDEPVSSLDVSIRAQIMNLFKDLQGKYGVSYLLIAHDLATTRYMSDHIAVMYLGRIVEQAGSEEIFERPLHPYTQALFSAALPSHPDIAQEEIILAGEVPSPIDLPSGCHFHARCPVKIGEICSTRTPEFVQVSPGHWAACHLYDDPGRLDKGATGTRQSGVRVDDVSPTQGGVDDE